MTFQKITRSLVHATLLVAVAAAAPAALAQPAGAPPATPPDLVATYTSIADMILSAKKVEAAVVRSILESTYGHANAALARAKGAMKAGDAKATQAAVESLAGYVGQLATEGDAAVAGIRKRLLEGGHHHNAKGEQQGIYEEGYVVVTRAAKTAFLEASRALGQIAQKPAEDALAREWSKVESTWAGLKK